MKRSVLLINTLSAIFLSIPSWSAYFTNMVKNRHCNMEELNIAKKFEYGSKSLWTQKTCAFFINILEATAILKHTVDDMNGIIDTDVVYTDYKSTLKAVLRKICFPEAESCLRGLANKVQYDNQSSAPHNTNFL